MENNVEKKFLNKNIIIIASIFVLLVVLGTFLFKGKESGIINTKKGVLDKVEIANLKNSFNKDTPIVIYDKKGFGFITYNGKEITDNRYYAATNFHDGYAIISKPGGYAVVDTKGKEVFESKRPIEYDKYNKMWVTNGELLDSNFKVISDKNLKYQSNGNYGYHGVIDEDKKELYIYKGKERVYKVEESLDKVWQYFTFSKGFDGKTFYYFINHKNGKKTLVNLNTKKIVYESEEEAGLLFSTPSLLRESKKGKHKYSFIKGDEVIYTVESDDVRLIDREKGILRIEDKNNNDYYYNVFKKKKYDKKDPEIKKILKSSEDEKFGYQVYRCEKTLLKGLKQNGKDILPCEYTEIVFLGEKTFNYFKYFKNKEYVLLLKNDSKTYKRQQVLYDLRSRKVVKTFEKEYYVYLGGETTFLYVKNFDKKKVKLYNLLTGKEKEFDYDDHIIYNELAVKVTDKDEVEYYNADFEKIYGYDK